MIDSVSESEVVLAQFNRLVQELLRGSMNRNTFRAWEIELLLDMQACDLQEGGRKELLKRYQKAVQKQMDKGAPMPMRLSEYLAAQRAKKQLAAENAGNGDSGD